MKLQNSPLVKKRPVGNNGKLRMSENRSLPHKLPNPLYNVNENIKLKQWFTTVSARLN